MSLDDAENPLAEVTDSHQIEGYEFWSALNDMLKRPYPDHIVNSDAFPRTITAGKLKTGERILQWIVSRILRPKKGGLSRVEQAEVHLMYILKNKQKINWLYYIANRMFSLRDSGRGTTCLRIFHSRGPYCSRRQSSCDERRMYKFIRRGNVPAPVAADDDSDESEEEEDEEEEAGQAFDHHGGDNSPPRVDTHDYSDSAWVQHSHSTEEDVPNQGGWGEWQHTGWSTQRQFYQPYHQDDEESPPSPPHHANSSELLDMMRNMQLAQQSFMQTQDERYAHISSQIQAQNERLDNLSTSMNERYAAFTEMFERRERSVDRSLKYLGGIVEQISSLADPYRNPDICYRQGRHH
ncbi:hypothetical protein KIW84_034526 [Lathyrus oleraceus]|uniref:Uncharacterized protein n=1 Tax=Pisum sativum TaxID=3888 RepID=A0A9D4XYN5_PEA|nr:hypothetical protein KIW84_034526 [Pisum sativum]